MKRLNPTLVPLAVAAAMLFAAPLAAQDNETVRSVRISVVDPQTGNELASVDPGQEITLSPGDEVILRVYEPGRPAPPPQDTAGYVRLRPGPDAARDRQFLARARRGDAAAQRCHRR